eukprot:3953281-Alexandrium_andersonii.AAC.1
MPHAAGPGAPTDADGRAAVAAHLRPRRQPEVLGHSHHAQAFGGALGDASKLRLAGTQSNGLLRRGPTLQRMQAAYAHSPASGPPGGEAPGEVGVHIRLIASPASCQGK